MSAYRFLIDGKWHQTETKGEPGGPPVKCTCGISNQDPRVVGWHATSDDDPSRQHAPCMPDEQLKAQALALRACVAYARDRRGGAFDFDEWNHMVETALKGGSLPTSLVEDAQAREAQAWKAVHQIRTSTRVANGDLDELKSRLKGAEADANWLRTAWETEIAKNAELSESLRIANAVRDDARDASARDVELRRHATALLNEQEKRFVEQEKRLAESKPRVHMECTRMPNGTGPCKCLDGCGACDSCGRWLCLDDSHTFVGDACRDCGKQAVPKPRHTHDCDACKFLGTVDGCDPYDNGKLTQFDLWFCPRSDGGSLIARYGKESSYLSSPVSIVRRSIMEGCLCHPALLWALQLHQGPA